MNAAPVLMQIVGALASARLEAVLIGNAAAAIQGARVTTNDFDFLIRSGQKAKIDAFAKTLGAGATAPYYPASQIVRVVREAGPHIQVDLLTRATGMRSFEGVRSKATRIPFGSGVLVVARLLDVVNSKRALGRLKDKAVLPLLEAALEAQGR